MGESKIKLGIVSNNNLERKSGFKKLLTNEFIDFFEIKSKDLNGDLDDFILTPTSLVNDDNDMLKGGSFIDAVANNIASAYLSMGLTNFTIDVNKYKDSIPNRGVELAPFLNDLSLAVQEALFENVEINITLKGLEKITGEPKYALKFLREVNTYIASYYDEEEAKIIYKSALVIGRNVKFMPIDIANSEVVYLNPVRVGKDLTFKEPIVRAWVNSILKAQKISGKPITLIYEDDIMSVASIANLIQMFRPELRENVKKLELGEKIDRLSR